MPLKYSDANMLQYFHEDKSDLTRYCDYEDLKQQLDSEYNLQQYLDAITKAERDLEMLLERMVQESLNEDEDY